MFIKWRRRRAGCSVSWGTISASVVESVWADGRSRHRYICYVASFADIGVPEDPNDFEARAAIMLIGSRHHRAHAFWDTAMANLARAGIEGDDLKKIVASLEDVVPRPTMDERAHPSYTPYVGGRRARQIYKELLKEIEDDPLGPRAPNEYFRRIFPDWLRKEGDDTPQG
jgi:hypothetical protein